MHLPYSSPVEINGNVQFRFSILVSSRGAELSQGAFKSPTFHICKEQLEEWRAKNWNHCEKAGPRKWFWEARSAKKKKRKMIRRDYLYWTSGAYKRLRDVKWHRSGKDTKVMKWRAGLYDMLINGQDDLGCLVTYKPLIKFSSPSAMAPTVTSAPPYKPVEMAQNGKGGLRMAVMGWEYRRVQTSGVYLSLGLTLTVGLKKLRCSLPLWCTCAVEIFTLQGAFH